MWKRSSTWWTSSTFSSTFSSTCWRSRLSSRERDMNINYRSAERRCPGGGLNTFLRGGRQPLLRVPFWDAGYLPLAWIYLPPKFHPSTPQTSALKAGCPKNPPETRTTNYYWVLTYYREDLWFLLFLFFYRFRWLVWRSYSCYTLIY